MAIIEELVNQWTEDSKRLILSSSAFAKNVFFYPQEIGYFRTDPPYSAARSNLESFLILLTLSPGGGCMEYDGKKIAQQENDVMFIDCMKPHRYRATDHWEFLWVHINGSNTKGYYNQFIESNPNNVLRLSDRTTCESCLRELIRVNESPSQYSEIRSSQIITDLLCELLLHNLSSYTRPHQFPQYLQDIMREIDRNYTENIRLENLAKKYNVNMHHLSKEFKRHYSINFKEYVTNRRIMHAKALLTYSDTPISEIAFSIGFDSVSHFISTFKARESMTPLAYRNLCKY